MNENEEQWAWSGPILLDHDTNEPLMCVTMIPCDDPKKDRWPGNQELIAQSPSLLRLLKRLRIVAEVSVRGWAVHSDMRDEVIKDLREVNARIKKIESLRRAFTLIELLVVITIIGLVTLALLSSGIVGAVQHRQVGEAARILQAGLAGAKDAAIRANSLGGIRLLADPVTANAYNGFLPLSQPPSYTDGLVSIVQSPSSYPQSALLGTSALVLEETVATFVGGALIPNPPTSWAWNVRVGDRIQINGAGPWYAVAGPMITSSPEGFINYGPPRSLSPISRQYTLANGTIVTINPEYLLLTNGLDDNQNGWIDEGFDGVDNNAVNGIDESAEWEQEGWLGSLAVGAGPLPYSIRRRPVPAAGARAIVLPTNMVIDAARSNLPTGAIDLVCAPTGLWSPSLPYSTSASITMGGNWLQFWLSERADVGATSPAGSWWLVSLNGKTGRVNSIELPNLTTGLTAARQE